mgnify:CR=1 FL=1
MLRRIDREQRIHARAQRRPTGTRGIEKPRTRLRREVDHALQQRMDLGGGGCVGQGCSSRTGRTSMLPTRAGGISAAIRIASFRSAASIR